MVVLQSKWKPGLCGITVSEMLHPFVGEMRGRVELFYLLATSNKLIIAVLELVCFVFKSLFKIQHTTKICLLTAVASSFNWRELLMEYSGSKISCLFSFSSFAPGFCIRLYGFCRSVCVPAQHLCAVLAI